jgi:GxxExxY protein
MSIFALCDQIRETSFALHRFLRHGHLEKVYENSLAHRLRKQDLAVTQQQRLAVKDEDGTLLGDFSADLMVADSLIVELKACRALADEHIAQLLGYLRATRVEHGLLINFGAPRLQIRKFALTNV